MAARAVRHVRQGLRADRAAILHGVRGRIHARRRRECVYRREGFITLSAPSIPLAAWQLGSRRDLDAAISRPISVQRS